MRLAVCSWSLQPAIRGSGAESRACGLDRVQLALSPVVRAPDVWGLVFEVLQDADISVGGMMGTVRRTILRSNPSPKLEACDPTVLGRQLGTRPSGGGAREVPRT